MLERFLRKTEFDSYEDFMANFELVVPENFNFAYDVVDAWAAEEPDRRALTWVNEHGLERSFSFAEMKAETDRTASFFASLGIGRGDRVMLVLKRRWQFWFSIIALHKLGATAIPATHLLTPHDFVYRIRKGHVKAIVAAGDPIITAHVDEAVAETGADIIRISTGPSPQAGTILTPRSKPPRPSCARRRSTPTPTSCSSTSPPEPPASRRWWRMTSHIPSAISSRRPAGTISHPKAAI